MLFFFKFLPEKYNPDKEKINAATNRWMFLYSFPGLFHFTAPMYIIKN